MKYWRITKSSHLQFQAHSNYLNSISSNTSIKSNPSPTNHLSKLPFTPSSLSTLPFSLVPISLPKTSFLSSTFCFTFCKSCLPIPLFVFFPSSLNYQWASVSPPNPSVNNYLIFQQELKDYRWDELGKTLIQFIQDKKASQKLRTQTEKIFALIRKMFVIPFHCFLFLYEK